MIYFNKNEISLNKKIYKFIYFKREIIYFNK